MRTSVGDCQMEGTKALCKVCGRACESTSQQHEEMVKLFIPASRGVQCFLRGGVSFVGALGGTMAQNRLPIWHQQ